ncbi:MAG: hypothetical protein ABF913_04925 [Oenococcus sp.]|uniref:hypothetical protein n=1 Tax=Oenococcus sp. TaxID=1979414 RepID=UPI0039ED5715
MQDFYEYDEQGHIKTIITKIGNSTIKNHFGAHGYMEFSVDEPKTSINDIVVSDIKPFYFKDDKSSGLDIEDFIASVHQGVKHFADVMDEKMAELNPNDQASQISKLRSELKTTADRDAKQNEQLAGLAVQITELRSDLKKLADRIG